MTNPNQMREVLLFVCFKMADGTNLSSKLPVADRSERESSVGDALALAFRCTSILYLKQIAFSRLTLSSPFRSKCNTVFALIIKIDGLQQTV